VPSPEVAVNTFATSAQQAGVVESARQSANEIPVETVMIDHVFTLVPHSSIITAAELMRREKVGSVPIVDGQSVVEIVTRSDVLNAFVSLNRQQPGEM
jgi:CBS domain-containing protein